jgi:hypothetical protein
MRTRIKVTDLNLRQWDYVVTQIPVDGREFFPNVPRVCAVFEVAPEISALHVEMDAEFLAVMDVAEFLTVMLKLEQIKNEPDVSELASAVLTPDAPLAGE